MSARSVSVTPAVKDLRNLFEQKARETPAPFSNKSPRIGETSLLLGSPTPTSRRPSPTPLLDDQTDFLAPPPEPSTSDKGSLRKRPPPPPPSRGQRQQLGSPSPSNSPLLRATQVQSNALENRSPPSIKQRLAARPSPPVPDLRLDRTVETETNSDTKSNVDASPLGLGSTAPLPLPSRRPVPPPGLQNAPYSDPFESDVADTDTPPSMPPRPNLKPPLPRRPVRLSFPPDPDSLEAELEFDNKTVSTKALALDDLHSWRKPTLHTSPQSSQQSLGRSSTSSPSSLSRVPSESNGTVPPPRIPLRSNPSKAPLVADRALTLSPVSAPPLPQRRPTTDSSDSSSRKGSGQIPPPVHPVSSSLPSRIPSLRQNSRVVNPRTTSTTVSHPVHRHQLSLDADDIDAGSQTAETVVSDDGDIGDTSSAGPLGLPRHKYGSSLSKMPPPPTRIIAPGDKLPAVRPTLSDDESEESAEEDPKSKVANAMPDTSRSSRRPPILDCHKYDPVQVQTQTHSAIVCAAGHIYVASSGHHVKVYDLNLSESPILTLDGRDMGLKELKATSLEFCPARAAQDKGRYVWIGTKDGHMHELDVITGQITGSRLSMHLYAITRILRHGNEIISLDDSGKVTVWTPEAAGEDLRLFTAQIRGSRISDRQGFVEIFAGKLWTSAREATTPGVRGPAVRIYDILAPGSATRSILPIEPVGTVTSGTILPSHPNHVYLGHEGGFVSIWSTATDDGVPVCEEVVRISNSDVLCLAGVNDRLWVGGRNGTIAAYNIESRPWVMTNNWVAHWNSQSPLPLQKIAVDPYSIDKLGRLCVYSVGRDDHVKYWDGLLGEDWQDSELFKLEKSFSRCRNITILFITWNIGASKPEQLSGSKENSSFLYDALNSVESPDIIVFGLQEVVPLDKANVAKFLKKKKGLDGASTTLHSEHRRWADKLVGAVAFALPDERYKLLHTKELVGLLSCVMVKTQEMATTRSCAAHTISRGVGGRFGNKGAIAVRLLMDDTSLCFLNCHLAAGHRRVRGRNADAAAIVEHERLFPEVETPDEALAFVGGGDGTMALDHEIVFMSGDLNYRIDQRRDVVVASVQQNTFQSLLAHDQLAKEMKTNVRLRSFMEGPIAFAPTYKYDPHSAEYDTSEKRRIPAWCDRVLWRARDPTRVEQLHYRRYEPDISDHRPVSAAFRVLVKSIRQDARSKMKEEVRSQWSMREIQLLVEAQAFYAEQLVL